MSVGSVSEVGWLVFTVVDCNYPAREATILSLVRSEGGRDPRRAAREPGQGLTAAAISVVVRARVLLAVLRSHLHTGFIPSQRLISANR